jgi:hypothetical protein
MKKMNIARIIMKRRNFNNKRSACLQISKEREYHIKGILNIKKSNKADLFLKNPIIK